jgi:tRNA threonylcarbamoyladenosine biosynthesis protein TsaE
MEARYLSNSAEETRAYGERLGALLQEGDVLVLTGDLGAGKTQLTKGIAAAMGVTDDVTSPTFALEAVHEGAEMPLYHFDLYRLTSADELGDAGVWDVLGGDGVCVIEWGEQFAEELGEERLDVYVTRLETEAAPGEEPRREIRVVSHDWRGDEVASALACA